MYIKLFNKWDTADIKVEDPGLKRYINLEPIMVPMTHMGIKTRKYLPEGGLGKINKWDTAPTSVMGIMVAREVAAACLKSNLKIDMNVETNMVPPPIPIPELKSATKKPSMLNAVLGKFFDVFTLDIIAASHFIFRMNTQDSDRLCNSCTIHHAPWRQYHPH